MENTNLVLLTSDNQPVTTSQIIAQAVNYQHHTVITLIRKYLQELEQFGPIEFQILSGRDAKGHGSDGEMAILNEQHTYSLIMLMRNNAIITKIKMRFVSAFFEMRKAVQNLQKQLEHHIPTDPELKAIYEQGRKQGYAIMMGYIAKNQVQGFQCFSNEIWEQMQKTTIPDGMTLVNKKSLEHALEVIKWLDGNLESYRQSFEAANAIYEQLQHIRDTAGLLTWNYAFYRKEALNLLN